MKLWTHIAVAGLAFLAFDVVTSIYTQGESIYGFALVLAGQPVCR